MGRDTPQAHLGSTGWEYKHIQRLSLAEVSHHLPAKSQSLMTQNLKFALSRGEKSVSELRFLAQLCFR